MKKKQTQPFQVEKKIKKKRDRERKEKGVWHDRVDVTQDYCSYPKGCSYTCQTDPDHSYVSLTLGPQRLAFPEYDPDCAFSLIT